MILTPLTYHKSKALIYFMLATVLLTTTSYTRGKESEQSNNALTIKPQRCVALRKGQTCYQEVIFTWQQNKKGNYCIVELPNEVVLHCWQQANSGVFALDFQASESKIYSLRQQDQDTNLAIQKITVAWVFKSSQRPKSSWKLF